jgi:hypothetical protein
MSRLPVPVSAKTKNKNTKASDALQIVPHVVTMSDGTTIEVPAADPLDAINMIKRVTTSWQAGIDEWRSNKPWLTDRSK